MAKPSDGRRSQDGNVVVEVLEPMGYRASCSSQLRGVKRCVTQRPEYTTGPPEGVNMQPVLSERSPAQHRSPAQSPPRNGWGAERTTTEERAGLTAGMEDMCGGVGSTRVCGEVGVCVFTGHQTSDDISLMKDKVAF